MLPVPFEEIEDDGHNVPIAVVSNENKFLVSPLLGASRYQRHVSDVALLDALILNKLSDVLVVSLHGAVNRQATELPRFERLRTLKELPVSSMFFGDPALYMDDDLQLAWYTGWDGVDIHATIAAWAVDAARALGAGRLIFCGSSGGGGFASLQCATHVPGSMALAFNAQTDISNYLINGSGYGAQRQYVKTVWPSLHDSFSSTLDIENRNWADSLDDRVSALRRYRMRQNNFVFIVQNVEEFHNEHHFLPFIQTVGHSLALDAVRTKTYADGPIHKVPNRAVFLDGLAEAMAWSRQLPVVPGLGQGGE